MELSLSEAARLLGKSDRQVRYLIRSGRIPARKHDGHWIIQREDLPLSDGQVRAERQKAERATRLAAEILRPDAGAAGAKKSYSVRETRAFEEGGPLYHDLKAETGAEHPAAVFLRESLMLLACGYHEFDAPKKAEIYSQARHQASRATMALLLDDEPHQELVARFETSFLPALGGLIHQADRRSRRR